MSAQAPPVSAVRAQKLTRYAMFLRDRFRDAEWIGSEIVEEEHAEGPWIKAAEVDEAHARVLAERDVDYALLDLITRSKSPCGHWGSHAYLMDDKGKHIACLDCENETLRQETRALREALAQTWQPIATAPNDVVLLYRPQLPPRDRIALRRASDWCGLSCCPSAEPTHWMPIPASPGAQKET